MTTRRRMRRPMSPAAFGPRAVVLGLLVATSAACGGDGAADGGLTGAAATGQQVAATNGCAACHSTDGSDGVGPSWKGAWGSEVPLDGGGTVTFDAAYVERSVRQPAAERRAGTTGQMPVFDTSRIDAAELDALIAYLQAVGDGSG